MQDKMKMGRDEAPIAVDIDDAARLLGVSRITVYRLLADHKLTARKCGRRTLFSMDDLREFLEELPKWTSAAEHDQRDTTGQTAEGEER